ncbi:MULTISPECIES: hypothetical protein [16SrI (Aster yellows group)]|uniref:Uncharacterized protein n=1 Tax=Candidatus Phytoplasma asteris TaxID=85620 RepID=A0ABZ3CFH4_9MOLU|nr:hypothetical protein [Maize bushy stunt phytoplasma]
MSFYFIRSNVRSNHQKIISLLKITKKTTQLQPKLQPPPKPQIGNAK